MAIKFFLTILSVSVLFISACEDMGDPVSSSKPTPSITSVTPDSGKSGDTVMVSGKNFGSSKGTSTVKFDGIAAVSTLWNDSIIVAIVPAGLAGGSTNVTVTVETKISTAKIFKMPISFQFGIRKLIDTYNCANCHPGNGGFSVATHATIITRVTVGNGNGSLLVQKLRGTAPGARMPNGGPDYMTPAEIQKFVDWIDQGAQNN